MSEYNERYGAYPMRVQVERGSDAEREHYQRAKRYSEKLELELELEALARGVEPSPVDDLIERGGKTVAEMGYQNVYLGHSGDFAAGDIENIDDAIRRAMQSPRLDNVLRQYFNGNAISCDALEGFVLEAEGPESIDEPGVQATVIELFERGLLHASDHDRTVFNLVLAPGTVLRLDDSTSKRGLGGYHGSVHFVHEGQRMTLYYSVNVYSERLVDGTRNGIIAFDASWKNVVGTLYHELCEFRTDPDVSDAIRENDLRFIGWNSRFGQEIGDQPISANALSQVFREVMLEPGPTATPVQFMYSNLAHGAEGPVDTLVEQRV